MSTRGGKRYGSGRKLLSPGSFERSNEKKEVAKRAWNKSNSRIYIRNDVLATFKALKSKCVYTTDTAFVQHLLSLELRRQERLEAKQAAKKIGETDTSNVEDSSVVSSTPVKRDRHSRSVLAVPIMQSPILAITVEANTSSGSESSSLEESSDDDSCYLDELGLSNALGNLVENADESSSSSGDDYEDYWGEESDSDSDPEITQEENEAVEFELSGIMDDGSEEDDNIAAAVASVATQTEEEEEPQEQSPPAPTAPLSVPSIRVQPRASKFNRWEDHEKYQQELSLVQATKVICSLDLLKQVFAKKCQHPDCQQQTWVDHTLCGTSVLVKWSCPLGHKGKFWSSHKVNGALVNNLQTSAAILLSGCSFIKVSKMAKFLGLSFPSSSTFFRAQRLYMIPAISEWWKWQQGQIFQELKEKELVVAGDGQCDSPGFTAKNLCYYLMEVTTSYIIEVEVLDKRETDMKSVNMEKQALHNILARLKTLLNIIELVTDASGSIKKLIVDTFNEIFHSLDVWHKSKGIRKCLTNVGGSKGMEKVAKWSDAIVRHFWHCCSEASKLQGSDEDKLKKIKDMWISLLYHVCNQHEWVDGVCNHDAIADQDHQLPWFDRRGKDFEALQAVILEPSLLESFKYYTRFRHTGALERANSMSLMYASKRYAYTKKIYKARKQLAAIDWNYHLDVPDAEDACGEVAVTRKYNQRTKKWNVKVVKQSKDYGYIWMLMARVFRLRMEDQDNMQRVVPMEPDDPRIIAPTIAVVPPPPSRELYVQHCSRFAKK